MLRDNKKDGGGLYDHVIALPGDIVSSLEEMHSTVSSVSFSQGVTNTREHTKTEQFQRLPQPRAEASIV